jgi:hypothetical protein
MKRIEKLEKKEKGGQKESNLESQAATSAVQSLPGSQTGSSGVEHQPDTGSPSDSPASVLRSPGGAVGAAIGGYQSQMNNSE